MPQLEFDSFSIQIFWLAIFFALSYFVVSRIFLPSMTFIFTTRETATRGKLEEAEGIAAEGKILKQEIASILDKAKDTALTLKHNAKNSAKKTFSEYVEEADGEFMKKVGREIEKIHRLEQKVKQELPDMAQLLSADIIKIMLEDHNIRSATHQ